jgi:hypothetical protein
MQRIKSTFSKSGRQRSRQERGVALITTLLLLMLLSGLAIAMAWTTQSDMMISGYYRNVRGSFYAADSGLSVVRQAMMNQFVTQANGGVLPNPGAFVAGTQPIPAGVADVGSVKGTISTNMNALYGGYTSLTGAGTGAATNSMPEQFKIVPNPVTGAAGFSIALDPNPSVACSWQAKDPLAKPQTGVCSVALPLGAATFTYVYDYSITVQGQSRGNENTIVTDKGILTIVSNSSAQNAIVNFAGYGMFIDQQGLCSGTLVPGTITGPVFTNGSWNFGTSGKYTFTDTVQQVNDQAGFGSPCTGVAGSSGGGVTPAFNGPNGFVRDAQAVPLPKNSFNQEQAVLDGKGVASAPPTNAQLSNPTGGVKDVNGNPFPSGGTNSGVFLPYSTINGVKTFTGGGILVQGNAAVTLSTSGSAAQVYTIVQNGVTTTISMNPTPSPGFPNGQTLMTSGNTTQIISGVPQMLDPVSGADEGYDTMLYVNGNITALSGPSNQTSPAIQNGTALTITAASGVTITGNITYTTEPVVMSGPNMDALNPAGDTRQALGIFTANGDIDMHAPTSNGSMEIDASIATISQGGSGGLKNTGNPIGTLTIVGGRIQNTIQNINTTTRNVLFDQRYKNGFSPPWFPSTQVAPNGVNNAGFNPPKISRLSWQNQTPY